MTDRRFWGRMPRNTDKLGLSVDHSPWVPQRHPSLLVAEQYALGDYIIRRLVGEAAYGLFSPVQVRAVAEGSLADMKAEGQRLRAEDACKGQEAPQEPQEGQADVQVADQGTIVLFRPLTDAGRTWIDENVQDDAQWFGGALVCEHRFAPYLVEGMVEGGLELSS